MKNLINYALISSLFIAPCGVLAQDIWGPNQITPSTTAIANGNTPFPLSQIADGNTDMTSPNANPFNGFQGARGQVGIISFELDQPYDLTEFYLWNDINVQNEGVRTFSLKMYDSNGSQVFSSPVYSTPTTAGPVNIAPKVIPLSVNGVKRVDMDILSLKQSLNRVEIREVAFSGTTSTPPPDPCCPPWSVDKLTDMMDYVGVGGISDPYTLAFNPTQSFLNQMQAYIDYVNSVTGANGISIHFKIYDYGVNGTGGNLPPSSSRFVTWSPGGNGTPSNGPVNFFDKNNPVDLMQVGRWYRVATGIYLHDNVKFFDSDCAGQDFMMRIQVQAMRNSPSKVLMQIKDASGNISERQIRLSKQNRLSK